MGQDRKRKLGIYETMSNVGLYGKDSDDIRLDTLAFIKEQQAKYHLSELGGEGENAMLASQYLEEVTRRYHALSHPPLWMRRLLDQMNSKPEHIKTAIQHVIYKQRAGQKDQKNRRQGYGGEKTDEDGTSDLSSDGVQAYDPSSASPIFDIDSSEHVPATIATRTPSSNGYNATYAAPSLADAFEMPRDASGRFLRGSIGSTQYLKREKTDSAATEDQTQQRTPSSNTDSHGTSAKRRRPQDSNDDLVMLHIRHLQRRLVQESLNVSLSVEERVRRECLGDFLGEVLIESKQLLAGSSTMATEAEKNMAKSIRLKYGY